MTPPRMTRTSSPRWSTSLNPMTRSSRPVPISPLCNKFADGGSCSLGASSRWVSSFRGRWWCRAGRDLDRNNHELFRGELLLCAGDRRQNYTVTRQRRRLPPGAGSVSAPLFVDLNGSTKDRWRSAGGVYRVVGREAARAELIVDRTGREA